MKSFFKNHVILPLKRIFNKLIRNPIKKLNAKAKTFINNHYFRRFTTLSYEKELKCKRRPAYKRMRTAVNNRVFWYVNKIDKEKDQSKKLSIVFICQFHAAWNACMSAFRAAVDDADVDVTLLALPEKVMRTGKSKRVSDITADVYDEENIAYEYCKSFYPETINGYDSETDTWFDLRGLRPDYVVISRSNQNYLPPQYRSEVLSTYTKVVHIPYAYCKMNWDSRAVYRENLTDFTYAVFTENEMYKNILRKIYFDLYDAKWKKIEFVGYPRFDLYDTDIKSANKEKLTVLWLPRWLTEGRLEASTFFKYKDVLIDYFMHHPEYKLICRPHPKMFGNFIATGEMTEEEVASFKELFEKTENMHLDEYSDYLPSFEEADVFISDTTSLLVEEFITGKPIIFCGVMWHFDKDAKEWSRQMYPVRNKRALIDQLELLLRGNDPKKIKRNEYIKEYMKHDGKSGERIIAFLKKDYYGRMERMTGVLPTGGTISL